MIERITVHSFILVDHLELQFTEGFNVLSGETGAGKSILVGALQVLFGGRGGAELVRSGAEEAQVTGTFIVTTLAESWLAERGILPEDGAVLVRRSIRTGGRGSISIQNIPVTRADLAEFSGFLMDLHSQHEHQSLFIEKNHQRLLDRFAGLTEEVEDFTSLFSDISVLKQQLRDLESRNQDRVRETEMLQFAIEEIHTSRLVPGEEEAQISERETLIHFEKLLSHLQAFSQLSQGDELDLVAGLRQARHELSEAAAIDSVLLPDSARLDSLYYEFEDVYSSVASYAEQLVFDPERLEQIEERLSLIRRLEKKYGNGIPAVLSYAEDAQARLNVLENLDNDRTGLEDRIRKAEKELVEKAAILHQKRTDAAKILESEIVPILHELALPEARFEVPVEVKLTQSGRPAYSSTGTDMVQFLFSANSGESVKPLSQIASGGEISRVMLAVKSVLAESDDIPTLVFDEIDSGIGGRVAVAMASYMSDLSKMKQVICITHLATIAVRADNHTVVEKNAQNDRTAVSVRTVTGAEREEEIARMLAGDSSGAESREHAKALLEKHRGS